MEESAYFKNPQIILMQVSVENTLIKMYFVCWVLGVCIFSAILCPYILHIHKILNGISLSI